VISLKKYIESESGELVKAMCESYRASLTAIGTSATQICPHIGEDVEHDLLNLRDQLSPDVTPDTVAQTGRQVEQELAKWGESASKYFQQTAHDIKEIMLTVAETSQALGERDQRFARDFNEFAGQLAAIGNLSDLTKIRQSLGKTAHQLKSCVEQMVQEGEQSLSQIRGELSQYQSRLDEAQRAATQDPVTGVANRYKAEARIQLLMQGSREYSVVMFDLDNFKQTNDRYGHLAGDELLRQFATELRSFFRVSDTVCRWGGDEFLVIVDCSAERISDRIQQIQQWVCGDYTIQTGGEPCRVKVQASVGVSSWRPGETAEQLIARADAAMYEEKTRKRKAAE
jgi:diguanylate cyclase (GGDEF)-like protein